jgi:hypothetical protein
MAAGSFASRVEFGMRVVIATLQQTVLFRDVPLERRGRSDGELASELARLLTFYLDAPVTDAVARRRQRNTRSRKETPR